MQLKNVFFPSENICTEGQTAAETFLVQGIRFHCQITRLVVSVQCIFDIDFTTKVVSERFRWNCGHI